MIVVTEPDVTSVEQTEDREPVCHTAVSPDDPTQTLCGKVIAPEPWCAGVELADAGGVRCVSCGRPRCPDCDRWAAPRGSR